MRGLLQTLATGIAGLLAAAPLASQATGAFDRNRLIFQDTTVYHPFVVESSLPLADALAAGDVNTDTRLLVMLHPAGMLAFLMDQMAYHHVAQGEITGEPWLVSF